MIKKLKFSAVVTFGLMVIALSLSATFHVGAQQPKAVVAAPAPVAVPDDRAAQLKQLDDQIETIFKEYNTQRALIAKDAAIDAGLSRKQLDSLEGPFAIMAGQQRTGKYEWRPKASPQITTAASPSLRP